MSGSWVSGEAPARRDNRTVRAGGEPQASLDRVVGTNQEIERRSRRTETSRLRLAWRTGSLPQSLACRLQRGSRAACVCQWWMPE